MPEIKIPGIVYSLLLAIGAWAVEYFTASDLPLAPILLATIPVILKIFTVQSPPPPPDSQGASRGSTEADSKTQSLLWG